MNKYLLIAALLLPLPSLEAVELPFPKDSIDTRYLNAYRELKAMLTDSIPADFKRAVFITENAFLDNSISYESYQKEIKKLAKIALWFRGNTDLHQN